MRPRRWPARPRTRPGLGCFRLGIVAVRRLAIAVPGRILPRHGGRRGHRHRAVRQGHLDRTRRGGVRARSGPGRFLSFQRPAGRRRPSNRFSQHVFALQETVEPGACGRTRHPVQDASDSGRTSVTSACAAARNATPAPVRAAGWRHRAGCVPARRGQSHIPAPAYCLDPARAARRRRPAGCAPAGAAARGPGPVAARRSPRVRRAARVGLAMFQALREQGDARCAPCGADQADASRKPRLFRRSR